MRKIAKPSIKVNEVVLDCISNMRNTTLKNEIESSIENFNKAESIFEEKKAKNKIYQIPQKETISLTINEDILKDIYISRMSKKGNSGRKYYDKIILSAPNEKCPLCNQRIVSTLDHYLPKSLYPIYSVTPINLIPSCWDCNKGKLIEHPTNEEEETLHPYYDDIENIQWLKMKIISLSPILFNFHVNTLTGNKLLIKRIENHFRNFKINNLYKSHASEEFENIKNQITNLFNRGGKSLMKSHLEEVYESRAIVNINSWQTAFYAGLLDSDHFCNGKFIS